MSGSVIDDRQQQCSHPSPWQDPPPVVLESLFRYFSTLEDGVSLLHTSSRVSSHWRRAAKDILSDDTGASRPALKLQQLPVLPPVVDSFHAQRELQNNVADNDRDSTRCAIVGNGGNVSDSKFLKDSGKEISSAESPFLKDGDDHERDPSQREPSQRDDRKRKIDKEINTRNVVDDAMQGHRKRTRVRGFHGVHSDNAKQQSASDHPDDHDSRLRMQRQQESEERETPLRSDGIQDSMPPSVGAHAEPYPVDGVSGGDGDGDCQGEESRVQKGFGAKLWTVVQQFFAGNFH